MLLLQQSSEIKRLVAQLRSIFSVQPRIDPNFPPGENDTVTDKYWIKEHIFLNYVRDQGSYVKKHLESLQANEKLSTLKQIGKFVVHVIEGMERIQAERDSNNDAAQNVSSPVMPSELVMVSPRDFAEDILGPRVPQLEKFWSHAQIEAVESQHRALCKANMLDETITSVLSSEGYETTFNDGWDALEKAADPNVFSHLRQFCCGLATVFANTASVESDFSVLKWELNDRRTALTSLALEGIFQAKQFHVLEFLDEQKSHEYL